MTPVVFPPFELDTVVFPEQVVQAVFVAVTFAFATVMELAVEVASPVYTDPLPVTVFPPVLLDDVVVLYVVFPLFVLVTVVPDCCQSQPDADADAANANASANAGASMRIFFIVCSPSFPVFSRGAARAGKRIMRRNRSDHFHPPIRTLSPSTFRLVKKPARIRQYESVELSPTFLPTMRAENPVAHRTAAFPRKAARDRIRFLSNNSLLKPLSTHSHGQPGRAACRKWDHSCRMIAGLFFFRKQTLFPKAVRPYRKADWDRTGNLSDACRLSASL